MGGDCFDAVGVGVGDIAGAKNGFLADFLPEHFGALAFEAEEFRLALFATTSLSLFGFPTFFFEGEFFGLEKDAAQLGELLGGADHGAALLVGIGGDEDLANEAAESEESGIGGAFGKGDGAGDLGEVVGFLGDLGGPVAGVFVAQPILEPALAPLAEVVLGDGASVEIVLEDFFDFGEGVEPGDETGADFAVGEAAVELIADEARETGDFADSGHTKKLMVDSG